MAMISLRLAEDPQGTAHVQGISLTFLAATVPLFMIACIRPCLLIGRGMGWSTAGSILAAVLLGIGYCFCIGLFGLVVVQTIAAGEMTKYGVKVGSFGRVRRVESDRAIAEMQASSQSQTAAEMGGHDV